MAKFEFDRLVTAEEVKGDLEGALGAGYRYNVKRNRIEIVQDAAVGCIVVVREKHGRTVCIGPVGYMPSSGLRAAIIFGALVLLFLAGLAMGYLVIGIGAIPLILVTLIMKIPSRELVERVKKILERKATRR